MATELIFDIASNVKGTPVSLRLSATYDDLPSKPSLIDFELEVKAGAKTSIVKATSRLDTPTVSINLSLTDKLGLCLLACAGKSLVSPLFECFDKDVSKYLACLRGKGFGIATDAITCSIACDP